MRRPEFLPLPGISRRDPNFYEGADYGDRARFAQPVNTGGVSSGVIEIGVDRDPTPELEGSPAPTDEGFTQRPDPSPFKLGGAR